MSLNQKIVEDLKEALKGRDAVRSSCLRLLKAALKNAQVEKRRDLNEEEIQMVISSMVKRGQDAAEQFRKGNREDLARKEEKEIEILQGYQPEQLTGGEVEAVLRSVISELSASGPKDLGRVMKVAMPRMKGRVQGKEANQIAQRLLSENTP